MTTNQRATQLKRMIVVALLVAGGFALHGSIAYAQSSSWQRIERTDPFRGTQYTQFVLTGKFLKAPHTAEDSAPRLVVTCKAGKHNRDTLNGFYLGGYVTTGSVLDEQVVEREHLLTGTAHVSVVPVQYRLDDDKIHKTEWFPSTDHSSAFFPETDFADLLYGHNLTHKRNSSPAVQKALIAMDEFQAEEVVMAFDMPDPTEVADVCGQLYTEKVK